MTDGLLAAYLAEYVSGGRQVQRDVVKMTRFGLKERGNVQGLEALGSGASEPPDQGERELGIQELKNGVK